MIGGRAMIEKIFMTRPGGHSAAAPVHALRKPAAAMATLTLAFLAGCTTGPDSVTVGAIPDDYRTNHPIVIAEKEHKIDLPVGADDRGMTTTQRVALGGFLDDYDRSASPVVYIMVPVGSANEAAASQAAGDFARYAKRHGVPGSRVALSSYQAGSAEVSAPVRVSYVAMTAQTDKCGRWPEDIGQTSENKHYTNFGCSYQNNLAAQVANPSDLLGPRKQSEIDAERRGVIIDDYRSAPTWIDPPVREVEY